MMYEKQFEHSRNAKYYFILLKTKKSKLTLTVQFKAFFPRNDPEISHACDSHIASARQGATDVKVCVC